MPERNRSEQEMRNGVDVNRWVLFLTGTIRQAIKRTLALIRLKKGL